MASLKVWHFIPSPFSLEESLVTISYYGYSKGDALIEFNGWGLPDISMMEHAPTEYMLYLHAGYRENNTAEWKYFDKTIRYNSEMYETHNVLMFMPIYTGNSNCVSAHLFGNLTVNPDYNNNQWTINIDTTAYLSNNTIQYPNRSSVLEFNVIALQGINIYY